MKTKRALTILLLIPLAACASERADRCAAQHGDCVQRAAPGRAPAPPASAAPVVVPPRDAAPVPPPTLGTCDPGGCWDTGGNRYNGSNGTFLNGSGRQCQRNGVSMQCF